eukprot:CAMPEP_0174263008 /NCGR_PEP_ID=MMETSP0439-20130205/16779_1 /TAXON_ID=0 /ORGANISM="Stereomyxa ramosa, Strain Chinc5" /LENGTH=461 /DNA_ID=CAMNT_0015348119 /DNA_START=35 /DNA_END=1420 /DNA_ORIENTATION=-
MIGTSHRVLVFVFMAFLCHLSYHYSMDSVGCNQLHTNSYGVKFSELGDDSWEKKVVTNDAGINKQIAGVGQSGILYLVLSNGALVNVTAVNFDGTVLWENGYVFPEDRDWQALELAEPLLIKQSADKSTETLFFGVNVANSGYFYSFIIFSVSGDDGKLLWRKNHTELYPASKMALNSKTDSIVLFGGNCLTCPPEETPMVSISCSTGEDVWRTFLQDKTETSWEYTVIDQNDGSIYVAVGDENIEKYDAKANFIFTWNAEYQLSSWQSFSLSQPGDLLVASGTDSVVACDTSTGKTKWTQELGECAYVSSVPSWDISGNIYISCSNYVLSLHKNGTVRWVTKKFGVQTNFAFELVLPPPEITSPKTLYFIASNNPSGTPPENYNVYAINMADGSLVGSVTIPNVAKGVWNSLTVFLVVDVDHQDGPGAMFFIQSLQYQGTSVPYGFHVSKLATSDFTVDS